MLVTLGGKTGYPLFRITFNCDWLAASQGFFSVHHTPK